MSDVQVSIGADQSALSTGLARAERSVDNFGKSAASSFGKMQAAFAGVVAVIATFQGLSGLLDEMGRLNDLSARLNETPETLQRIGNAAKQNGSDLEIVVKGLQKVSKSAVDAAKGNLQAGEAFEALNINAADFAAMSTEDKLAALADGFNNAKNSTLAFDAILQVAGKSGAELIPLLTQGADGIKQAYDSAAVASGDTVNRLDAVGDRMGAVFQTLKVWGAEALGFLIEKIDLLSVGIAGMLSYVSALPKGLAAASQAFDDTIAAAADLQLKQEQANADQAEQRKNRAKLDPEDLKDKSAERAKELKNAEDLETQKAKIKQEIADKKTATFVDSLSDEKKANYYEDRIASQEQKIKESGDPESVAGLEAQKKKLEFEEKLKAVRKDIDKTQTSEDTENLSKGEKKSYYEDRIAAEEQKIRESGNPDSLPALEAAQRKLELAEKLKQVQKDIASDDAKEGKKSAVDDAKDKLKEGEDALSKVKGGAATSIDSLRSIGGSVGGVNYDAISKRDALQQQTVALAKEQVEQLKKAVVLLQNANGTTTDTGDGSFS